MTEASWRQCLEENSALTVTTDLQKASSLRKTAAARIRFFESHKLTRENCDFIFEGYYASVLELLHALVISKGYKVANHLCLGLYLKDTLKREDLFRIFDDARYKRNGIVYYGRRMDLLTVERTLSQLRKLRREIEHMLEEKG